MATKRKKSLKVRSRELVEQWFETDKAWFAFSRTLRRAKRGTDQALAILEGLPAMLARFRGLSKELADLADVHGVDAETTLPLREFALSLKDYPMPSGLPVAFAPATEAMRAKCWPRVQRIRAILTARVEKAPSQKVLTGGEVGRLDYLAVSVVEMLEDRDGEHFKVDWAPKDVAKALGHARSNRILNRDGEKYRCPEFISRWTAQNAKNEERKCQLRQKTRL